VAVTSNRFTVLITYLKNNDNPHNNWRPIRKWIDFNAISPKTCDYHSACWHLHFDFFVNLTTVCVRWSISERYRCDTPSRLGAEGCVVLVLVDLFEFQPCICIPCIISVRVATNSVNRYGVTN